MNKQTIEEAANAIYPESKDGTYNDITENFPFYRYGFKQGAEWVLSQESTGFMNIEDLKKGFRQECPETIGETDKAFDNSNYIEWLEKKLLKSLCKPISNISLPTDCQSKEDGVCRLPIGTCTQCK